ncbi:CLUMA_CG014416, isoform A, partial [Clunio marinus]
MFVSDVGDVKIFNLSAGKSLPDWLTDRKKRSALNKNVDLRRRIVLIQDFEMPGVSTSIRMSPDNQFILATGTYKPRVKCYDVNHLSVKFERCFDSEVETFEILSEDYSKMVFLHTDRYLEFHVGHGRHYKLRVPKIGRSLSYHTPSCDLLIVGSSPDIYRLNLERGQFLQPFETQCSGFNTSDINPEHQLLCVGSAEGTVEAWDPRDKKKCSSLDVAMKIKNNREFPSITSIKFKNGLQMGVGTATGHVLIYDIRSNEPLIIKDHLNRLPVKKIAFNQSHNVVCSMDSAMLKIWDETSGKQTAYIESQSNFNDFCTIPNTGMFFFAQEDVKMQTFYIPSLGPAPKWCSFLDNLTEEIESEVAQNIYDDYKFVTKQELVDLGLDHLEGTNLLKAYMHGYFVDMRLYQKAVSTVNPFTFEKYRKEKVAKKIEETRPQRLQVKSDVPKVNKEVALKFMDIEETGKKTKNPNLLRDDRFKAMFENPDFEVDKETEEYRLLKPLLVQLDKSKLKKLEKKYKEQDKNIDENEQSTDDDLFSEKDESSDDDIQWTKEVKKEYKKIRKEKKRQENESSPEPENDHQKSVEMHDIDDFNLKEVSRKSCNLNTMEIVKKNFIDFLPEVIKDIEECAFISFDGEFTGLASERNIMPFDTSQEYYEKQMKTSSGFILIQLGLTFFKIKPESEKVSLKSYNIFVYPQSKNATFQCQGQSLSFLAENGFDFNKLFKNGISFCNAMEEEKLRQEMQEKQDLRLEQLKENSNDEEQDTTARNYIPIPENEKEIIANAQLKIQSIIDGKEKNATFDKLNNFQRKLIYELIEREFHNKVSTSTKNLENNRKVLIVEVKRTAEEELGLERHRQKEEELKLAESVGLRLLLKAISASKKLIVGHNCLLDLMYLMTQCFENLPTDYNEFKSLTHRIFPNIIDTKFIASSEKFKDIFSSTVLTHLYDRLKQQPFEEMKYEFEDPYRSYSLDNPKEHEAGYDSFLTGYCLLVLLKYLKVSLNQHFEPTKCKELIPYLNRIALQRIQTPYIYITGNEPSFSRSHVFFVKFPSTWRTNDLQDQFKNYGPVQITWVNGTSAFISLYNRENSSCVLKTISRSPGFEIQSFDEFRSLENLRKIDLNRKRKIEVTADEKMDSASTVIGGKKKREGKKAFPENDV